ncbi:MAG: UdgX family uracil-DNA binding protein [Verrucomicrobiales bacterium]|nr:UdgX family uracil-DNA binding protein [Verrucomicrobiales bacterium]
METISVRIEPSFESWRKEARRLLERAIRPDLILWSDASTAQEDLFGQTAVTELPGEIRPVKISKAFLDLARTVSCHSNEERWGLMYQIAWRMVCNGETNLLKKVTDSDTRKLMEMAKAIRRDCHKMNAFVRFRKVGEDPHTGREQFVAWFEPSHHIIEYNASFFVKRFTGMDWSILSPEKCIHWDGVNLHTSEGVSKEAAPTEDSLEELWRGYYKSIFNPARLKLKAMQAEMPKKYWKNLPEADLIEELTRQSSTRRDEMIEAESIAPRPAPRNAYLNSLHDRNKTAVVNESAPLHDKSLEELNQLASCCRACPLWAKATQTVFGTGNPNARIMIIGEQPGDREDLEGRPFVGPAGRLLNEALAEAGLERDDLYLTNAVKHFKWKPSPTDRKKRLHDKANRGEMEACKPWLIAEVMKVQPSIIVTLGNTAAQSVVRKDFRVLSERGKVDTGNSIGFSGSIIATVHPSFLLRIRDQKEKQLELEKFTADLALALES